MSIPPTDETQITVRSSAYRILYTRGDDVLTPAQYRASFETLLDRAFHNRPNIADETLAIARAVSATAFACSEYSAAATAAIELTLVDSAGAPMDSPYFAHFQSMASRLLYQITIGLQLFGRCYLRKQYNDAGYPTGLEWVSPADVRERTDADGVVQWYDVRQISGAVEKVPVEQMIYIPLFDVRADGNGLSKFEVAWRAVGIEQGLATHVAAFFVNSARPDGMLTFDQPLTDDDFADAQTNWQQFKGSGNAYKTAVMPGGARWTPIQSSLADLDTSAIRQEQRRDIAAIFGVDLALVGLADVADPLSANSTFTAKEVNHLRNVVLPRLRMTILPALNNQWAQRDFPPRNTYTLTVNERNIPALADANLTKSQTALSLTQTPLLDYNEGRELLGYAERADYLTRDPKDPLALFQGGGVLLNEMRRMVGMSDFGNNGRVLLINGTLLPIDRLYEIANTNADKVAQPAPSPFGYPLSEFAAGLSSAETPALTAPAELPPPVPMDAPAQRSGFPLELAIAFPDHQFIRYARRALSEFLTEREVSAEWVSESDWRLPLVRLDEWTPADAADLIRRADYAAGRKLDLEAAGFVLTDGMIVLRVTESDALNALQKAAQLDADAAGKHALALAPGIPLCRVTDAVDVSGIPDEPYALVATNVALYMGGTLHHQWQLRGVSDAQARELRNWRHVARRKGTHHPFAVHALDGSPVVRLVRDALDADCDLEGVFDAADALLRGDVASPEAARARMTAREATPDEFTAFWKSYDALMPEIGETWLREYMAQALQRIGTMDTPNDIQIASVLSALENDLVDAWTGTDAAPGALTKLVLAGMAAGNEALARDRSINPKRALDVTVDWTLLSKQALEFARQYCYSLIRRLNDTTLQLVREAVATWMQSGEPMDTLRAALTVLFEDENRARLIAQTETTRVYNEGAFERWREAGVTRAKWQTVRDGAVCPVCEPLHNSVGTLSGGWRSSAGDVKPPAHPGCRCFSRPVLED